MKTMTRQQLAEDAGVDRKTLRNWIVAHYDELKPLGMPYKYGTIPPIAVKYIIEHYVV